MPEQLAGVAYTFMIAFAMALAMLLVERLVYTQRNGRSVWLRKLNKALGLVYWKMRPASVDVRANIAALEAMAAQRRNEEAAETQES